MNNEPNSIEPTPAALSLEERRRQCIDIISRMNDLALSEALPRLDAINRYWTAREQRKT